MRTSKSHIIRGFDAFEERDVRVEAAARNIVALCREDRFGRGWRPKGLDETAILLESLGYSAEIVSELWYASLFDFAADVNRYVEKYVADEETTRVSDSNWFITACKDYAIGSLYAGPWIVAVLGLAVCGASLWSSLAMPLHAATVIALGMYASLAVSGAFAQPAARRLMFYVLQENTQLTAWTLDRLLGCAAGMLLVLGAFGVWGLGPIYGYPYAWLAVSFFIASALFQISLAPLYTLRRFGRIILIASTASALTGLTFILAFHRRLSLPWQSETLAAEIGAVGLFTIAATVWMMHKRARRVDRLASPSLPALFASVVPYAAFGICYFPAIIVDHLAAGLTNGSPFYYRSGYELGTDIALLATVPIVGSINIALESLPRRILACAALGVSENERFNRTMTFFYLRSLGAVFLAATAAVGLTELLGRLALSGAQSPHGATGEEALFVLQFAAIGDGLLMLGLLNAQFLFFLSRPYPILSAILCALVTNAGWGILVCMNHFPAAWCVFGLDAGATAFAVLTSIYAFRAMRTFMYSYYAAY